VQDFKELLRWIWEEGIGRPVQEAGQPLGPWNPDLLIEAFSQLEDSGADIELRTIQFWFEDNERGMSYQNIQKLSSLVGCGDPDKTREWRAALNSAKSRLRQKRTARRKSSAKPSYGVVRNNLATRLEAYFGGDELLILLVITWTGCTIVGFLAYIFGVHSVTYIPNSDVEKQVGFLWAPNWTFLQLVLIPCYLIILGNLITYWKKTGRGLLLLEPAEGYESDTWLRKVGSYDVSFWAIFVICFFIVFLVQWLGLYFRPIFYGEAGNQIIDWSNITAMRPEVMSSAGALFLSFVAFAYAGLICFLFLAGLVFLFVLSQDYYELCKSAQLAQIKAYDVKVGDVGSRILIGVFRCSVAGILIASCIKIYSAYLKTDSHNILVWIGHDFMYALNIKSGKSGSLGTFALGDFSSFMILFLTCFVFVVSFVHVYLASLKNENVQKTNDRKHEHGRTFLNLNGFIKTGSIAIVLVLNYFSLGQFEGFSLLLFVSLCITTLSLFLGPDDFRIE